MREVKLSEVEALYQRPLEEVVSEAWAVRQANFPPSLKLAAPGAKRYEVDGFRNSPHKFVDVSLTGRACALQCEHCRGRLLETMRPATTPAALRALADELISKGCQGVLLSGGSDAEGRVPLAGYFEAIAYLKERGLRVIVHSGLLDQATAHGLKAAGVDQVLLDVIGDEQTIRRVYHLDKTPQDYAAALALLKEVGLSIAPHIVIGLHFGQMRGELEALRQITAAGVEVIVLVVLNPLLRTPMKEFLPPPPGAVGKIVALARLLNPRTPLALGCARPAFLKADVDRLAIAAGVNTLAYPGEEAIVHARSLGLAVEFAEMCCSLL
ncbi:MAG TPA: radical SAM protein [Anaerolineae bacterium]|nr:radical SAM protein [Anaerolineae bacterium]